MVNAIERRGEDLLGKENSEFSFFVLVFGVWCQRATTAIRMVGRTSPFAAIDFHSKEEKFFVFHLATPSSC